MIVSQVMLLSFVVQNFISIPSHLDEVNFTY